MEFGVQFHFELTLDQTDEANSVASQSAPVIKERSTCVMPLHNFIGYIEGTYKGDGYNEIWAFGAHTSGDVNLTKLTLAKIDALQSTYWLILRTNGTRLPLLATKSC